MKNDNKEFNSLFKKYIIQYNQKQQCYIYSHQNIVNYLFFREYVEEIKTLNFEDKSIINIIQKEPKQFINWWLSLGEKGDIFNFLIINKINISVRDHKLIDKNLTNNNIWYSKLTFYDLKILSNKEKYQRIYEEYLLENINTNHILNKKDSFAKDIVYFVYSIISPIRGDDYFPRIMNSMKKTGFENKIKWINGTNRHKMLNYNLGRYIQGYTNPKFSALYISELTNTLFSNWDIKNKFKFYDFVKKYWDITEDYFSLEDDKSNAYYFAEHFDSVLNSGKGRGSILDASSRYNDFDNRFHTSRNASGELIFNIGH